MLKNNFMKTWNSHSVSLSVLVTSTPVFHRKQVGDPSRDHFDDPDRNNSSRSPCDAHDERKANAGLITLPIVILNHGNTVKAYWYFVPLKRVRCAQRDNRT